MRATHDLGHLQAEVGLCSHIAEGALRAQQLERAAHDAIRIDGAQRILLRPGVIEQAADDPVEALELPAHPFGDFLICAAASQHLQVRPGGAQRVADLMRDTRREPSDARQFFRADQLALRVEQPVRHPVQPFREGREIASVGIGRAGGEIAVGDRVGGFHHARQRAQDETAHEGAAVEYEDPDFGCDEDHHEYHAAFRSDRERELRRRDAHEDRKGGEECEVEEQLDAERRLGARAAHGTPR